MSEDTKQRASASAPFPAPEEVFKKTCALIEVLGFAVEWESESAIKAAVRAGEIRLSYSAEHLHIELIAEDARRLQMLKEAVVRQFGQSNPAMAEGLRWSDGAEEGGAPAGFRELTYLRRAEVFPGMTRFTFAGERLGAYLIGGLHIRLLFPPEGVAAPRWPTLAANGSTVWPQGEDAAKARYYTVRAVRPGAAHGHSNGHANNRDEIDIDMLLHSTEAAAGWIARSAPGDVVGAIGPGGGDLPGPGRRLLLGGDLTALPALARIFEAAPQAEGRCVIAAGPEAIPYLAVPPGVALSRLAPDGDPNELVAAMLEMTPPQDQPFMVWFAGEQEQARRVREHFRRDLGLGPDRQLCASYWRRGAEQQA